MCVAKKFTGTLGEPIYRADWHERRWLSYPGEWRADVVDLDAIELARWDEAAHARINLEEERLKRVVEEKMILLATHFEALDQDGRPDWRLLAERLAEATVPGLSIRDKTPFDPKPGRPKSNKALLGREIRRVMLENGLSALGACRKIAKKREGPWHRAKPRVLSSDIMSGCAKPLRRGL